MDLPKELCKRWGRGDRKFPVEIYRKIEMYLVVFNVCTGCYRERRLLSARWRNGEGNLHRIFGPAYYDFYHFKPSKFLSFGNERACSKIWRMGWYEHGVILREKLRGRKDGIWRWWVDGRIEGEKKERKRKKREEEELGPILVGKRRRDM